METNNAKLAEEYYLQISLKNIEGIKKYLHPAVDFCSPLTKTKGIDALVENTGNFMKAFNSLIIRSKFSSGDQAVIVYDVDIPAISSQFPGVSLLTFQNGLIAKIELFFDASPFKRF